MSQPYKRKLIEVGLPLEAINVASAREKSVRHGHPSTLHLWWARRPLAACRAVLFASLVDDPSSDPERFPTLKAQEDERRRLFGIIERLVLWENTTNEAVLEEARVEIRRSTGGNPPPVLDPFCGGGSIPLEAQRLGLTAYASDLNPVAVLITKALIEIPPKFAGRPPVHPDARRGVGGTGTWRGAAGLAEDVRRYGAWMRDQAERRIGYLYPKVRLPKDLGGGQATVIAWLWARTVICPNPACGAQLPLVRSFALSTKKGQQAWVHPIVDRTRKTVHFEIRTGDLERPNEEELKSGTGVMNDKDKNVQATFRCLVCKVGIAKGDYVDGEANARRMGEQLLAVVAEGPRGRVYLAPSDDQLEPLEVARMMVQEPNMVARLPTEPARGTFASNAQGRTYGLRQFKDYFTSRQLVALDMYCDLITEARDRITSDAEAADTSAQEPSDAVTSSATAYADAVVTYLALCLDRLADLSSSMATWIADLGAVRNTFARQGIAMSWDYAECNPITDKWAGAVGWVSRVLDGLPASTSAPGTARQLDAARAASIGAGFAVCTDPPYYSNIDYADLSDFFYVWLRRTLGDVYPELFGTVLTPKDAELVASRYRFGGDQGRADAHFEAGLGSAFARIRSAATPDAPFTVFYAFKQAESDVDSGEGSHSVTSTGWEKMLEGLLASGFSIDGTWPMRTERTARSISIGTNALASSIVLVCRPRQVEAGVTTRKDFVAAIKRELPEALRTLQHGNIAPVDLAQASIGPGMAVFSRYAKVLEPDGSPMRVRTALALINQALDEILAEQESEFDADTRWAIAWYEQFGLGESAFGTAETLSKAKNTSIRGLIDAGILAAGKGKVRLLRREELSLDWDPATDRRTPVWEATQRLVHSLLTEGETDAAALLARIGGLAEVGRDLAYRLYGIADRKRWTEDALAYNALVKAWPELVRVSEVERRGRPAQGSLGLE